MGRIVVFACWGIFLLIVAGCAIKPKAEFIDSFYTYQDKQGKKFFSYILEVKESETFRPSNNNQAFQGTGSRKNPKSKAQSEEANRLKSISMIGDPDDARVSLKFRMEEIAHQKLKTKLSESNYCPGPVEFEQDVYLDFRYKIKGFCAE